MHDTYISYIITIFTGNINIKYKYYNYNIYILFTGIFYINFFILFNKSGNEPHSSVGESAVGMATQIRPQEIEVKARPGSTQSAYFCFTNCIYRKNIRSVNMLLIYK